MKPIFLDTNAYAAFKRGDSEAIQVLHRASSIVVNAVVLGELYSGFAAGNREQANRSELGDFLALPTVEIVTLGDATARHYAAIYLQLRKSGKPIPTNDMWIAASALEHALALFSYDAHFRSVEGLLSGATISELAAAD